MITCISKNHLYPGNLPYIDLKTVRLTFFKINQMQSAVFQSCLFVSIRPSLSFCCISFMLQHEQFEVVITIFQSYFLGILGVMKLDTALHFQD